MGASALISEVPSAALVLPSHFGLAHGPMEQLDNTIHSSTLPPCAVQYSSESLVAEVFAQPSPDRHAFPPALVAQGRHSSHPQVFFSSQNGPPAAHRGMIADSRSSALGPPSACGRGRWFQCSSWKHSKGQQTLFHRLSYLARVGLWQSHQSLCCTFPRGYSCSVKKCVKAQVCKYTSQEPEPHH